MSGILDIGVSALKTNQSALRVTGNNIANANNEDYTRQRISFEALPEQLRQGGYVGNGINASDINRTLDEFALKQVWLDTATNSSFNSAQSHLEKLDIILSDPSSSLAPKINELFVAIEAAAKEPLSEPLRQVAISKMDSLANNFRQMNSRIQDMQTNLQEHMIENVNQINSLAERLVNLNRNITQGFGANGEEPNGLQDKREALIGELAQLIDIQTIREGDGDINIYIGKGQPLVLGTNSFRLDVVNNASNPGSMTIMSNHEAHSKVNVTDSIKGGELGGLLGFSDQQLEPALNTLGRLSLTIADAINQQNRQGLTLDGNHGETIFADINSPEMVNNRAGKIVGNASLHVTIQDTAALGNSNYKLHVNAVDPTQAILFIENSDEEIPGNFILQDHDNDAGTADVQVFVPNDPSKHQGIRIHVASGTIATSDIYTIKPVRNAASYISLEEKNPRQLAFSSLVRTETSKNNRGLGVISSGEVIQAANRSGELQHAFSTPGQLTPPIEIEFTSDTAYVVKDTSSVPAIDLFNGSIVPGQKNDVFANQEITPTNTVSGIPLYTSPIYMGYQVQLSGNPKAGDKFTIGFNSGGQSDNRNGIKLGQLREARIMQNGEVSIEQAYNRMTEKVGVATAENRVSAESSLSILNASQNRHERTAGVNMDEEAANLIQYEQAYNASAQLIKVARTIFDTLLNSV